MAQGMKDETVNWSKVDWGKVYLATFVRISKALREADFWKPDYVSLADASGGDLPLPKTWLNLEFKMLADAYREIESGRMKMVLGKTGD